MKSQYFSVISNVLLLITTVCIRELVGQNDFKDTKCSTAIKHLPINEDVDVLNPLYIFK